MRELNFAYSALEITPYLDGLQGKLNALRELQSPSFYSGDDSQSASGEELSTLMPSILDQAFRGVVAFSTILPSHGGG
jgi:hypothetical protein